MTVTLRPATDADVPFLVGLFGGVSRTQAAPAELGVLVVEVDGEPAGSVTWERSNRRSRIASVGGFAVGSSYRGRGVGVEAARLLQRHLIRERGFHRLQMEVYGFNERALRHAERAGWIREGVRREAYWRNEQWVDGVLFGLVEEDLPAD